MASFIHRDIHLKQGLIELEISAVSLGKEDKNFVISFRSGLLYKFILFRANNESFRSYD